jgi:hypothetical protein
MKPSTNSPITACSFSSPVEPFSSAFRARYIAVKYLKQRCPSVTNIDATNIAVANITVKYLVPVFTSLHTSPSGVGHT